MELTARAIGGHYNGQELTLIAHGPDFIGRARVPSQRLFVSFAEVLNGARMEAVKTEVYRYRYFAQAGGVPPGVMNTPFWVSTFLNDDEATTRATAALEMDKRKAEFDKLPKPRTVDRIVVDMPECHCGKDGHALNSVNCPAHGDVCLDIFALLQKGMAKAEIDQVVKPSRSWRMLNAGASVRPASISPADFRTKQGLASPTEITPEDSAAIGKALTRTR